MRVFIVFIKVLLDGLDEVRDAVEGSSAYALIGQSAEPAFDQVEP